MKVWALPLIFGVLIAFTGNTYAVNVRGMPSCGAWVQQRQNPGVMTLASQLWLVGFLSGLAVGTSKEFWGEPNVNLLSNESVFLWMDNYCRSNPLKSINEGGTDLFIERASELNKR